MIDSPKSLRTCASMTIKVTTCPSNSKCDHTVSVTGDQNGCLVNDCKQTCGVLLFLFFSIAENAWRISHDTACIIPCSFASRTRLRTADFPHLLYPSTCRQTPEPFTARAPHSELMVSATSLHSCFLQVRLAPGFSIPEPRCARPLQRMSGRDFFHPHPKFGRRFLSGFYF